MWHVKIKRMSVQISRMNVQITRMIVQITVPKSHAGCLRHTHDVKITLVRVA
jgi:hypothetical protein